jgi:hypothetical protein
LPRTQFFKPQVVKRHIQQHILLLRVVAVVALMAAAAAQEDCLLEALH